jgi:hypothetical protein
LDAFESIAVRRLVWSYGKLKYQLRQSVANLAGQRFVASGGSWLNRH